MPIYPGAGQTWSRNYQHPQLVYPSIPLFTFTNNLDGIVPGSNITTGNSGGVSGTAFDSVNQSSATSDNSFVAHGLASAKIQTVSSGTTYVRWSSFGTQPILYFRFNFLATALPAANSRILTFQSGNINAGNLLLTTTGTFRWNDANGTTVITSVNAIVPGQWIRLEGFEYGNAVSGHQELKIFNNIESVVPLETISSNANTLEQLSTISFGTTTATANYGPFWFDDLGVTNIGYMGPVAFPEFVPQLEAFPGQQWQKNYQHRQSTYLTTPDINIGPPQAIVNVTSPAGSLAITPDPNSQTANVNVVANAGNIGSITSTPPQFPFDPLLPSTLQFNPAYIGLKQQYNTVLPDVFISGAFGNVSVSGQADNSITETISGVTALVNVSAPAGSLLITAPNPPSFPFAPALPVPLNLNPKFFGLRQQVSTALPNVFTPGNSASVNISGQVDNSVQETITGTVSNVNVAAPSGSILITLSGTVSNVSVAAPTGIVNIVITGVVTNVNSASPSGSLSFAFQGLTSNVNVVAVPGTPMTPTAITGVNSAISVVAIPGTITLGPLIRPDWWRVYRGYATYPAW